MPVKQINPLSGDKETGFVVSVANEFIRCKDVLIATNGYTRSSLSKYLSRRILPVPSFIITTDEIGAERVNSLIPGGHCIVETRKRYCYYRPTPCGKRIMIGTRAAMHSMSAEKALPLLRKTLSEIFPELDGVKIRKNLIDESLFSAIRNGEHFALDLLISTINSSLFMK